MSVRLSLVWLLVAFGSLPQVLHANDADNPLAPFERLIGGRWAIEGSYQEFSWGVGKRSVTARGYFVFDGEARLVSEGSWYWHPGEKTIRGTFTATGMPVVLFDYTTRFEGDAMVSDLRAWDNEGKELHYRETWTFIDDVRDYRRYP